MVLCGGCGTSGRHVHGRNPYVVNGVRLVRAPAAVHHACNDCNGTFSATGSFPAPRGYRGVLNEHRTGHFTVWAEPRKLIRQWLVGCPDGRVFGRGRISGLATTWTTCPSGSGLDSGHVLLEWSRDNWRYALSPLHSNTPTNRQLLRIICRPAVLRGWVGGGSASAVVDVAAHIIKVRRASHMSVSE
jgi:hypothetical protein